MVEFIRKYTLVIVVLALILLVWHGDIYNSSVVIIAGQAIALLLAISARIAFKNQQLKLTAYPGSGSLINSGPYKFIRHPMYTAVNLFIWVSICGHFSLFSALVGSIVTIFALMRIAVEEKLLREHYQEYDAYTLVTKKMIPFIY